MDAAESLRRTSEALLGTDSFLVFSLTKILMLSLDRLLAKIGEVPIFFHFSY